MQALFKSPIFWLIVIGVIAIVGYSLYTDYTSPVNDVNDNSAPDHTDAKPGVSRVGVGFADSNPSSATSAQALPTANRPYSKPEFNPVV